MLGKEGAEWGGRTSRGRGEGGEREAERAGTHFRRETDPHTRTECARDTRRAGARGSGWPPVSLPPLTLTRKWCCRSCSREPRFLHAPSLPPSPRQTRSRAAAKRRRERRKRKGGEGGKWQCRGGGNGERGGMQRSSHFRERQSISGAANAPEYSGQKLRQVGAEVASAQGRARALCGCDATTEAKAGSAEGRSRTFRITVPGFRRGLLGKWEGENRQVYELYIRYGAGVGGGGR